MSDSNEVRDLAFWCYKVNFSIMDSLSYELQRFKVYFSIEKSDFGFCILFTGGDPNPDFDGISISVSPYLFGNRGCEKLNIIEIILLKRKVDKNNSIELVLLEKYGDENPISFNINKDKFEFDEYYGMLFKKEDYIRMSLDELLKDSTNLISLLFREVIRLVSIKE